MAGDARRRRTDRGWRRLVRENAYRDAWSFALTVIVVLSLWFGYSSNRDRIDDIQRARARNTLVACEQANVEHAAIVGFIERSVPAARRNSPRVVAYLMRARQVFPQHDCAAVVRRAVKP